MTQWQPTAWQDHFNARIDIVAAEDPSLTALEHQTLDPRVDMSPEETVQEFTCPKCNRKFEDLGSCLQHARSRRHANFCSYDRSLLPQCLNAHMMLPAHANSGYCDIQGRRPTIEDFHTIHLNANHQFYAVFDGHLGNLASKYAAATFHQQVEHRLEMINESLPPDWEPKVKEAMADSFKDLHVGISRAVESSPGGVMKESGTTATVLYVTNLALVLANVGDSRAIMTAWTGDMLVAAQLSVDHIASAPQEQALVESKGGSISRSGGIERVQGRLAVTRSLGDVKLAPFLSREPHVFVATKADFFALCGTDKRSCFIILASDGLWDVMSNQEAIDLAWQVVETEKGSVAAFQEAAEVLTQEAYIRGSSDNIGVCVVSIEQD